MKKTAILAAMVLTLGIGSTALAADNGSKMMNNDQTGMHQPAPAKAQKKEMKKVQKDAPGKTKAGYKKKMDNTGAKHQMDQKDPGMMETPVN